MKGKSLKQMGQISIRVQKRLVEVAENSSRKNLWIKDRFALSSTLWVVVNPEVKMFFPRSSEHCFMDRRGFVEVETPVLATLAGAPMHDLCDASQYAGYCDIYCAGTALKRLIVGGLIKYMKSAVCFVKAWMQPII